MSLLEKTGYRTPTDIRKKDSFLLTETEAPVRGPRHQGCQKWVSTR